MWGFCLSGEPTYMHSVTIAGAGCAETRHIWMQAEQRILPRRVLTERIFSSRALSPQAVLLLHKGSCMPPHSKLGIASCSHKLQPFVRQI